MSSSSTGSILLGILLILIAGILNGSWNAAFHPRANLAVGPSTSSSSTTTTTTSPHDLQHPHAFCLYSLYAGIINIPLCLYWAGGPQRVAAILDASPTYAIILVVLFSWLWGFGTLLFGVACKVAGVGLGTNLSMGTIAILGTLLPLITEGTLISRVGGVISAGLGVCCVGLWFATIALKQRDLELEGRGGGGSNEEEEHDLALKVKEMEDDSEMVQPSEPESNALHPEEINSDDDTTILPSQSNNNYKVWQKVAICLICGLFAVQLQFAFIFGQPIVDLASGADPAAASLPGSTPPSGEAAIIWLFAFSMSTPISILYGILVSSVPISCIVKAPWWRHVRLVFSTSIPWLAHIHLVRLLFYHSFGLLSEERIVSYFCHLVGVVSRRHS